MFRGEADAVEGTQPCHTTEGVKLVESSLKMTLIGIVQSLFGKCKYRWVDATFPFTYPSWELEIFYKGKFSKAFFFIIIPLLSRVLIFSGFMGKIQKISLSLIVVSENLEKNVAQSFVTDA